MGEKDCKEEHISLMLLREDVWKVDDRVNILVETIADHEAELLRQKQMIDTLSNNINRITARETSRSLRNGQNGENQIRNRDT